MKLINVKMAGQKIGSSDGDLHVDSSGVVECDNEGLCEALLNSGFEKFLGESKPEPKAEEPKEEPKAEEPKAEEPKAEEPKAEEPKEEEKPKRKRRKWQKREDK